MNYPNIHDPYYRALDDKEYFSFTANAASSHGYIEKFRAFIPPGTVLMDLFIIETGGQKAVAKHNLAVDTFSFPDGNPNCPTLAELILGNCFVFPNKESTLHITYDSFDPPLDIKRAGWLYVKVGGGEPSDIYDTHFTVRVHVPTFNAWWDQYIVDGHGWQQYVEAVITYEALTPIVLDPSTPVADPTIATLSKDGELRIPDILLPDGKTHAWANLQLVPISGQFKIAGYGVVK